MLPVNRLSVLLFTISGVKKGATIEVSFVGYVTQNIVWNGSALNVTLKDDTQALEEVVVVGYGTQKKANLSGSVASVDSKQLQNRPIQKRQQRFARFDAGCNHYGNQRCSGYG